MLYQKKDENKKLIPLRRLAEEGPYKTAYLSLLVQRNKLKATKVGRNYFTTREWFKEYLEKHARDSKKEIEPIAKKEESIIDGAEIDFSSVTIPEIKKEEITPIASSAKKEIGSKEELDFSVLEKVGEDDKNLKNWEEQISQVEDEFLNSEKNFSKKLNIFKPWRFGLTVASLVLFTAVFLFLTPGAYASFGETMGRVASAPVEAVKGVVRSAGEVIARTSQVVKESQIVKKINSDNPARTGQVAGANEENTIIKSFLDKTKEAFTATKKGVGGVFQDIAQFQEDLSFKLNNQVTNLALAGAGRVKGVSESGTAKLSQLSDKMEEAGQNVKYYAQASKSSLLGGISNSFTSLGNLYTKIVDWMIPDSLQENLGEPALVTTQEPEKTATPPAVETEKETVPTQPAVKVSTPVKTQTPASQTPSGTSASSSSASSGSTSSSSDSSSSDSSSSNSSSSGSSGSTSSPSPSSSFVQNQAPSTVLPSVGGTTNVNGNLVVNGAATFYNDITVKGTIYGGSPVKIAGGLKVSGPAEFTDSLAVAGNISANTLDINSGTIDNNLNVGGTVNTNFLNVNGSFSAKYASITNLNTSGFLAGNGVSAGEGGLSSSGGLTVRKDNSGDIVNILDGTTQVFVIADGGNVGIGTSSPKHKLDINGNLGLTAGQYINWDETDGENGYGIKDNSGTLQFKNSGGSWADIAGTTWSTSGSDINYTAGNIGVGTTTPYSRLSVWGDGTNPIFEAVDSASSTKMVILNNGRVGVGTVNPVATLDVNGTIQLERYGDETGYDVRRANGTIDSPTQVLAGDRIGYLVGGAYYSGASSGFSNTTAMSFYAAEDQTNTARGSYIKFDTTNIGAASRTEKMRIDSSGKVGIGTTSPEKILDILGGNGNQFRITSGNTAWASSFSLDTKVQNGEWVIQVDGTAGTLPGALRFINVDQGGTAPLIITHGKNIAIGYDNPGTAKLAVDGNVGIGTTSPWGLLSVNANAIGTAPQFVVGSSTATNFIVASNGNVGIGTEVPATLLELEKSGGGAILKFESPGNRALRMGIPVGSTNFVIADSDDLASNRWLTIPSSGNIGIGTTSPMSKLSVTSNSGSQLTLAYDDTNYANFTVGSDSQLTIAPANNATTTIGVGDEALRVDSSGNVGIGTTTAKSKLSILGGVDINRGVIVATGDIDISGSYLTNGADYAEYYYSINTDLEPGEAVCVDVERENAVKRCDRTADDNLMGVVSTKPAIVGNGGPGKDGIEKSEDNHYSIIGMLGQVPARVTTAGGAIRPGDSLTSASRPGYLMRASAGDSTVGVALEGVSGDETSINTGVVNVLISRRNKSLTVEEVEERVAERVAAMEIEDEVNILIANAIDNLNLNDEIAETVDPKLLLLETKLTIKSDELTSRIVKTEANIEAIVGSLANLTSDVNILKSKIAELTGSLGYAPIDGFMVDEDGNIKLGKNISTSTPATAVVEIVSPSGEAKTAFVINQTGSGDVADFRYQDISVMNINNQRKVSIIGNLQVDGRIMACSGSSCGEALNSAVDETMGDIGVEGKVVAGAFEGYCENGFVWVPGSAKYGTLPGFCVAEKKTRNNDEVVTNISQGEAQLACQSLGSGYHLLNDNEWLTMAENIVKVGKNDIDEINPGLQLATSSPVFILTNGNTVYEMAGVMGEWTDQTVTKKGCPELSGLDEWQEYYNVIDYKGLAIASPYYFDDESNNIGKIKIGSENDVLRGFIRGFGGLYGLDLSQAPTAVSDSISFRCAK